MPNNQTPSFERPSPDALLREAQQEKRGRLRVFFGAAPGVGKTYSMLRAAQQRMQEGVDVVVGIVETHGRPETHQLVQGLPALPLREVDYRGHALKEFDLDAALARKPQLILVDELAHTNAPASRHPKRYQDVEELLAAGIDVYSTLNVQHIESLNDVVAQITRVRVKETIPDAVLEKADQIELIDISSEELLRRLQEGKVYLPEQARRAIQHFFAPGNLAALRELALRHTAQAVERKLVHYMQTHAIKGPWPAGERVMVCLNDNPLAPRLLRAAKRSANRLHAPWVAVFVETPYHASLPAERKEHITGALRLADRLGAEVVTLTGSDPAEEILRYAEQHNVTRILLGQTRNRRWFKRLFPSLMHQILDRAHGIDVMILTAPPEKGEEEESKLILRARPAPVSQPRDYLYSFGWVGLATLAGIAGNQIFSVTSMALLYLMAVLVSATSYGTIPSLLAAILSAFLYNFVFVEPQGGFAFTRSENFLSFTIFLAVAIVTSDLASRVRNQAREANRRERATAALYSFTRQLLGMTTLDNLLWTVAQQISAIMNVNATILLPAKDRLTVRASSPADDTLNEGEIAAAQWAFDHQQPAGWATETLPALQRLFLPMTTPRGVVGVLAVLPRISETLNNREDRRLLSALNDQAAAALERMGLARGMEEIRLKVESDQMRSAFLASVSQELKEPLTAMLQASKEIREGRTSPSSSLVQAEEMEEQGGQLQRLLTNLIDIAQLEAGEIHPNFQQVDLESLIVGLCKDSHLMLAAHRIDFKVEPNLPKIRTDPVLLEKVLWNLLDNAVKYSPAQSTLTIKAAPQNDKMVIQVRDEGAGIETGDLTRVFDKFYRVQNKQSIPPAAGAGIGLSVCRGMVQLLNGTIQASSPGLGKGTTFQVELPLSPVA
ncbi:MAG: DUF4118 domain-containing protein [Dongiaceae bacterium]